MSATTNAPVAPDALAPAVLEHLAATPAVAAVARLDRMAAALGTCGDPRRLEALAHAIPTRVSPLEAEVGLALLDVARALQPYGPTIPDDVDALAPRLRVGWLRVQLAAGDASRLDAFDDETVRHVVLGWTLDDVRAPQLLLARLARAADPRLRAHVARCVKPLVEQLALTGPDAFAVLEPLADDAEPAIRAEVIGLLAKHWLLGLSPGAQRRRALAIQRALRDAEPVIARAAVTAAAELGERAWLAEQIGDPACADAVRAEAITALGPIANDDDLAAVLALVPRDPLRFAGPARGFLLDAHRHGVFVRDPDLAGVLAMFDGHAAWTADELIRVTYIARGALIAALAALPADDPRWLRRAGVLAASLGTGAERVIAEQLAATRSPAIAAALVDAAGRSPEFADEPLLLRWLDAIPEAVIPALRVKGGAASAQRLRALVEDPFTPGEVRALAMPVLWALEPDRPGLRRVLVRELGPHASGLLDERYLTSRDPRAAELLIARGWDDRPEHDIDPNRELAVYCEAGDPRFLPDVTRVFREIYRGHVRRALEGDFSIKRLMLPELEQRVFRYGRHLIKDGRSVRRWIEPGPETGRDLVLRLVLDWLAEQPSDAVQVALLETAARHAPDGMALRFLEPYWRSGPPGVRRAAIEALVAAGANARGLELSLGRLVGDAGDPRILEQALAAVRTLRAAWAEPLVRAALQRPEMGVKKEAAEALAEIGDARSIPALVDWLARHDNASLRSSLQRALLRAAGPAYVAVIVDALERADDARTTELLSEALASQLTTAAVLRLARSTHAAHLALVGACLDGRVRVADATPDELAARLHRARLRPTTAALDPAQQLRVEGFSPAAARALVAARTPRLDAAILPTVRAGLADWIAWLSGEPEDSAASASVRPDGERASESLRLDGARTPVSARPDGERASSTLRPTAPDGGDAAALALVLDAAEPRHAELVPALLELLERRPAIPEMIGYLERCVVPPPHRPAERLRAIHLVRRAPPSAAVGGHRRYRLLAALGAVRTLADLEACLAACRIGRDVSGESFALLSDALAIPAEPTGAAQRAEPPELTALREAARDWYRQPDSRWLAAAVAARPLDLPIAPPPPARPARPSATAASAADRDALLAALAGDDAAARQLAATRLLAWPDARDAWPAVRDAYLAARVELGDAELPKLAATLTAWPDAPRAERLAPHLGAHQLRAFVPAWLAAWAAGDATREPLLRVADRVHGRLLPFVVERARAGRFVFARLLRGSREPWSHALRELAADAAARGDRDAEADVAHLIPPPSVAPASSDRADPVDPLASASLAALIAIIDARGVEKGLAVRAVHALIRHAEHAIDPLDRLTRDRRPPVRSAALRALRVVASRERTLEAATQVLAMETRRDVVLSLMASLGHGRHEPALADLIERLSDREPRIRQGAHDALRAWGHSVVPALRRAVRKARPDRRAPLEALIAELG